MTTTTDFYEKGNAHRIPMMASKSCNAVSPRDLYVPLSAKLIVNDTNRTYTIIVSPSCYFGTRININNLFSNLKLDNSDRPNYTLNGWVSEEEPGALFPANVPISIGGSFNAEGKPDHAVWEVPFTGTMTYYSDVGCATQKTINFSNSIKIEIPDIAPHYTAPATPTISNISVLDDAIICNAATTSFGEGGGKYLYVEAATSSAFTTIVTTSEVINELSGTFRLSNLQRNTRYYFRAVAANNGMTSFSTTTNRRTLAASRIDRVIPTGPDTATITAVIFNGSGSYAPSTKVQISADGGTTWTKVGSDSTSKTTMSVDATGLTANTTYLFRTMTTTSAGTYESPRVEYTTPRGADWGYITSITPSGTSAVVKFKAFSNNGPSMATTIYYRPYGLEEDWVKASGIVYTQSGQEGSKTITDLVPNYAEYEVMLYIVDNHPDIFESEPVQFFTVPEVQANCTCSSLDYLTQLICQSLKAISTGNIKVFANEDTKNWCEGGDAVPTMASIWSRITRYMHAVACTLCSMDGFVELMQQRSTSGNVFMGEMGWMPTDTVATDGSPNLILSRYVKTEIDNLIRKVWHYVGEYDFYAENPLELNAQSGTATGQYAVMGNKRYRWNGSSWVENGTPTMENFGVIHINRGIHADKAYYWFVDGWNRLDADTSEIEARLDALEAIRTVHTVDSNQYVLRTADISLTDAQLAQNIPTDATRTTIVILTEDV